MKLSTRHRYGLRAMVELACCDGRTQLDRIAVSQEISRKYLDAIFSTLKAAGLVQSRRGVGGGQRLLKDPGEIRVGDIFRAIEGQLAITDCIANAQSCERAETCVARGVWVRLNQAIERCLDEIVLADLVEQELAQRDLREPPKLAKKG